MKKSVNDVTYLQFGSGLTIDYCMIGVRSGKTVERVDPMWLPKSVFIVGQDPLASALRRSLSLFCEACYKHHVAEILNGNNVKGVRNSSASEIKAQLRPSRILIYLLYDANSCSEVIKVVHSLRDRRKWNWEGCFIAVVNKNEDKEQIENINILGQKSQGRVLRDVPGHYVVCHPFMVMDLLRDVRGMSEMSHEVWEALTGEWVIKDMHDKLDKAEAALWKKEKQEAQALCREVITLLDEIDWLIWLPHSQHRMLDLLIKEYRSKSVLMEGECLQVISKVRQLLVENCLRM